MSDPASTPSPGAPAPSAAPSPSSVAAIGNELDAAKAIVNAVRGLEKAQQERAIRYATETLGLAVPPPVQQSSTLAAPVASAVAPAHPPAGRPVDIKQFTEAKAPKSDNQFAAVVAYYHRFEAPPDQRRETIDDTAVKEAARLVGRKRPSRMVLTNAKNRGYLDSVGNGEFRINTVGENLVAVTLPNNDEPTRRNAPAKKARSRAPKKGK